MEVRATSFRIGALVLGAIGVAATFSFVAFSPVAIVCGIFFGAGGWLLDYFTGFRRLGGQLSSWVLVAGGAIVLFLLRPDAESGDLSATSYYGVLWQYVSVALVCWGVLMFVVQGRRREP